MGKQATLRDIAQHCGLSLATVSRVLSDSSYVVSDATRKRVLDSARQLNYTPNELGKSLKTRSTRDIGVILPNITNPYYALLLQGITDEAEKQGYHILLCSSHRNAAREAENIMTLLGKRVDGILISSINPDLEAVRRAMYAGCRVIAIEQTLDLNCPQVSFDYRQGALIATQHLILLGHRRIGFIGAPLDRPSRRMMLEGYRAALSEAGIALNPANEMLAGLESERVGVYEIENGGDCARAFMKMDRMPTGYVCLNDMTAIGAMRAFWTAGYRIPEDLSLIGFDNIPFCELTTPGLTTVEQHAYSLGRLSIRRMIEGEHAGEIPAPTLVVRGTTAPVRRDADQRK